MNVRRTVQHNLLRYPGIFATKSDVFQHLFLVTGNGYEWEGGELVDGSEEGDKALFTPAWRDPEACDPLMRLYAERENAQLRFVVAHFDLLFEERITFSRIVQVVPKHARLFHPPADIKPDWLTAVNHASQALKIWLYDQQQLARINNFPEIATANNHLRKEHFAEQDRELAKFITEVLRIAERSRDA